MKIKAVCEATGLTDRTIRYYIEERLISPAYTENYLGRKTFDFSESNIKALNDIAVLRKFGFSISEIKQMLLRPEEIPRIVSELRERKQAHIDEETELLQALSKLNTAHSYTVPELADSLSEPVSNTPLPKEDLSFWHIFTRVCSAYFLIRFGKILPAIVLLFIGLIILAYIPNRYTETTDIADYGTYTGTYNDGFTRAYIDSFFPESISDSFTNIKYSYKAKKFDTYAFEAYLEFSIDDVAEFSNLIQSIAPNAEWKPFAFDESFMEYNIENVFIIHDPEEFEESPDHPIEYAKIRKILYSAKTQTIIYIAIGVYDGGGVGTDYLCVFFNRFGIDPVEYKQTADSSYEKGPYDIT